MNTLTRKIHHAMICLYNSSETIAKTQNLFVYIFYVVKHHRFCNAFVFSTSFIKLKFNLTNVIMRNKVDLSFFIYMWNFGNFQHWADSPDRAGLKLNCRIRHLLGASTHYPHCTCMNPGYELLWVNCILLSRAHVVV